MSDTSTSTSSGVPSPQSSGPRPRRGLVVVSAISLVVALVTIVANGLAAYQVQKPWAVEPSVLEDGTGGGQKTKPEPVTPNQLPPEQVEALAKVGQNSGANPEQVQSLRRLLSDPDQRAIRQSATTQEAVSQLRTAQIVQGGLLVLAAPVGPVVIAADGTVRADGSPTTAPAAAPSLAREEQVAIPTARLFLLDAGMSLVLGLLLLIAAIAGLTRSARAVSLHRAYALLKIVAAIVVAAIWVRGEYPPFVPAGALGQLLAQWSANLAVVSLLGCLYPLILLLALGAFGRRGSAPAAA